MTEYGLQVRFDDVSGQVGDDDHFRVGFLNFRVDIHVDV